MSQLQNCSVMCTKNGSYCENEKKEKRSQGEGQGGCVQRMEVIVKRRGSQDRCDRRSETFVKIQKKKNFFLGGGGSGRGGGRG